MLRVANRGHEAPLLVHEGKVLLLEPTTPALPLGLGLLDADDEIPVDLFDLPVGATLVLYTDGINEARDADGSSSIPFRRCPGTSRPIRTRYSTPSSPPSPGTPGAISRTTPPSSPSPWTTPFRGGPTAARPGDGPSGAQRVARPRCPFTPSARSTAGAGPRPPRRRAGCASRGRTGRRTPHPGRRSR
ncbi:SpoIIE family protein phosphatase [Streptomyces sp. INA 01156]